MFRSISRSHISRARRCALLDLPGANFRDAILVDADLQNADLRGATLVEANLQGACLNGADLSGSNAYNATFDKAHVSGTQFQRACLNGEAYRYGVGKQQLNEACTDDDSVVRGQTMKQWCKALGCSS